MKDYANAGIMYTCIDQVALTLNANVRNIEK